MTKVIVPSLASLLLLGCGAQVVLEDDGGSGGSGTTSTTSGTTKSTTAATQTTNVGSSSTGFVACDDHGDCGITPGDDVCVFKTGFCAQRCGPGSPPCPPGLVCDDCATGSCPACQDCVGACL